MNARASEYYWGILGLQEDAEGCKRLLEKAGGSVRALHPCKEEGQAPAGKNVRLWGST